MFCLELLSDLPVEQLPFLPIGKGIYTIEKHDYTPELDNHTSVIFDICTVLQSSGHIRFSLSGFGQESWSIDVWGDLSAVIDQVIEQLHRYASGNYEGSIHFFEQGTEMYLVFVENDDGTINIQCCKQPIMLPLSTSEQTLKSFRTIDGLTVISVFDAEQIEKQELYVMMKEVKDNFLLYANKLCPNLLAEPLFSKWLAQYPE